MNQELVWSFETASFRVECLFSPDDDVDTSFDETGETQDNINSGFWQAFCTEVRVIHKNTGAVLSEDFLSGSIYEKPLDFIKEHYGCKPKGYGSYFPDMVRQAIHDARKQLHTLNAIALRTA